VKKICAVLDELAPKKLNGLNSFSDLITYVEDRPGHDVRYAVNTNKIQKDLGWKAQENFESGIGKTIDWYLKNSAWSDNILNGTYQLSRLGVN
ncbi:MAG: dTDP-glucose 4,6-dehydratase, partial [Candidatus Marinimicrobia bacterium]|nr:dTDP-glucose 4,6-dehydratase [Candidatus Neomarinimicrobiota bacterium]